jgi:hypothetical protein
MEDWEENDVEQFEELVQKSRGQQHDPAALADCPCRRCALRRFGGKPREGGLIYRDKQGENGEDGAVENPLGAGGGDTE